MMGQVAHRHAPRLTDGSRSSRHSGIFKMSGALEVLITSDQHFPAPDVPIGTVASPVKGKSDYATFKVILRHTTRNVRMVVLHTKQLHSTLLQRPFCGEVIGVEIVGDDLRPDLENPLKMPDGFVKKTIAFDVLQISDVLAQESVLSFCKADGVFQLASDRQHRRLIVFQENRHRNKAA